MTVRFPSGFSIQYNTAMYADWGLGQGAHTRLYTGEPTKGGKLIASIPESCIVEWATPCRTYNPISMGADRVQEELVQLAKEVRSLKRKLVAK